MLHADALFILTAVDRVAINWGKPDRKSLEEMSIAEAEKYIGENQFAPGSMLPKVQAAIAFAQSGGRAIIADAQCCPGTGRQVRYRYPQVIASHS